MINRKQFPLLFLFLVIISFCFCKDNKKREEKSNSSQEWIEKEILFPEDVSCYVLDKDTLPELCDINLRKEFKILMYVDSAGCSSCRLKLLEWKQLIEEAEILYPGKVGFLFYFQPKNIKEITDFLLINGFDYPIFIDTKGAIDSLNRFPKPAQYRLSQVQQAALNPCFLLDKNNQVLATGNPTVKPQKWDSYKYEIETGDKNLKKINTSVMIDKTVHDFGSIPKDSIHRSIFTITNTGDHPFVISRVSSSCGCTRVTWERQPVKSGNQAIVGADIKLSQSGYFKKNLIVYCNADHSPVILMLTGYAE